MIRHWIGQPFKAKAIEVVLLR